jgi:hypothetical protein
MEAFMVAAVVVAVVAAIADARRSAAMLGKS